MAAVALMWEKVDQAMEATQVGAELVPLVEAANRLQVGALRHRLDLAVAEQMAGVVRADPEVPES